MDDAFYAALALGLFMIVVLGLWMWVIGNYDD